MSIPKKHDLSDDEGDQGGIKRSTDKAGRDCAMTKEQKPIGKTALVAFCSGYSVYRKREWLPDGHVALKEWTVTPQGNTVDKFITVE